MDSPPLPLDEQHPFFDQILNIEAGHSLTHTEFSRVVPRIEGEKVCGKCEEPVLSLIQVG